MKQVYILFLFCLSSTFTLYSQNTEPPAAYGPVPTPQQVQWQQMEYYMFVHFGPNTFTSSEWGQGKESPRVFNPTRLDCRQWAAIAKAAGMKAIILTAKHHDGFCLWPSQYSKYTVRESNWKEGKGDVLQELSQACREYGLKLGFYVSPWDRNHPAYGTSEYNEVFTNTLTEVLSNYGPVFVQWFDGANGEWPDGKKQTYDWNQYAEVIHKLQPQAVIYGGPIRDVRWVGNERGEAGTTNWSLLTSDHSIIDGASIKVLGTGMENGIQWLPAEVDVSIRPRWFYNPADNQRIKTAEKLFEIYCSSVGRNGNLLLNIPPDTDGLIYPADSANLMGFKALLDSSFRRNLIKNATIKASHTRGKSETFSVKNLRDTLYDSYWTTDDEQLTADLEIKFSTPQTLNCVVLQEYIPLGQRVKAFSIEYWDGKQWQTVSRQTTIGYKRIVSFPTIKTGKLRINIEQALACPILSSIGVFKTIEYSGTKKQNLR